MAIIIEPKITNAKVQSNTVLRVDIILWVKRKWKHNGKLKIKTNGQPNMQAMKLKVKLEIKFDVDLVERYLRAYLIELKYKIMATEDGNSSTEAWK